MKVAVIGSREFNDYALLKQLLSKEGITQIISGGAPGADSLAIDYATEMGIPWIVYKAKWDDLSHPDARIKMNTYGKQYDANAGFRRNKLIVTECDRLVAFHDGKSPGTFNSMKEAKKQGKKITLVKYKLL